MQSSHRQAGPDIGEAFPNPKRSFNGPPWPCWLEVDLDAIENNAQQLKRLVGPSTSVMAVVKAEGYGVGAEAVARAAIRGGAAQLAVARVQEGVHLRQCGLKCPVLVLSSFTPHEVDLLVRYSLTPTVVEMDDLLLVAQAADKAGVRLPVQVKVDTGLNRFGARPEMALALARKAAGLAPLKLAGFYTHFSTADEADLSFCLQQLAVFKQFCTLLAQDGIHPDTYHAANSAGGIRLPEARLDLVRCGIALLGYRASPWVPEALPLVRSLSFKARVSRLFHLSPGETVGYGRTFEVKRPMRAALISAGYADGLPRSHSNLGEVLIRGQRTPIIGRVSMDQCVVDVTNVPDVSLGDEAVLFGSQGEQSITLEEFASWSDTIPHEVLCRIGPRVPRVYRRDGQVVEVVRLSGHLASAGPPGNGTT